MCGRYASSNNPEDLIEEFDGMTAEHLRTTKIGKVMKRIMQLGDIPREDDFHFKERAEKLCARWGAIMAGSGDAHKDTPGDDSVAEHAKENGDASTDAPEAAKPKPEADDTPSAPAAESS